MGTIKISDIPTLRLAAFEALYERCKKINSISLDEFALFIILLAEFLYLESAPSGECRKAVYMVFADTVHYHYRNTVYSKLAYSVVKLRNGLCHMFGTKHVSIALNDMYDHKDNILKFCEYLGLYSA